MHLKSVIGICILVSPLANVAYAGGSDGEICDKKWHAQISKFLKFKPKYEEDGHPIIFLSDSGKVYDCLDFNVQKSSMETVEIILRDLSRYADSKKSNASGLKASACDYSWVNIANESFILIELPKDLKILNSSACQKRLNRVLTEVAEGNL